MNNLKKIAIFNVFIFGLSNFGSIFSVAEKADSIELILSGKAKLVKEKVELVDVIKVMISENFEQIYARLKEMGKDDRKSLVEIFYSITLKKNYSRVKNGTYYCCRALPIFSFNNDFFDLWVEASGEKILDVLKLDESNSSKKLKIDILNELSQFMKIGSFNVKKELRLRYILGGGFALAVSLSLLTIGGLLCMGADFSCD